MIRGNNTDTLEVHKWCSYFVFFPRDFREVMYRLALRRNEELDEKTKRLMSYVLYALYENRLLSESISIANYLQLEAFITSNPNIDTRDITLDGGGGCAYIRKGISPESPITISCPDDLIKDVIERIVIYITEGRLYIPRYESWNVINIESRTINGEVRYVCTVQVRFYNIFGKTTSQHLVEWFFKNKSFDDDYFKRLIVDYISKFGKASRKEIDELLRNILYEALNERQKYDKITNLLSSLKRKGIITFDRNKNWILVK